MRYVKYMDRFEREDLKFARSFGSKTSYLDKHEKTNRHDITFNARIYLETTYERFKNTQIKDWFKGMHFQVWYGDLDLTTDREKLKRISKDLGNLIITTEHGEFVEKI